MEAIREIDPPPATPPSPLRQTAAVLHLDLLLDALKTALADPREQRLFASGKLPGLFRSRYGPPAEAALHAIKEGLFETVRTEAKGRLIVEWVRASAKGVGFVHAHDSPKAVLTELKQAIGETRGGLPLWMADVRGELADVGRKFEERAGELTAKLDELSRRVDAALRRIDAGPRLGVEARVVPWAETALEHLDRRTAAGAYDPCSLGELFHAVRQTVPALSVGEFHDGLRRLHDTRAVRLSGTSVNPGARADPEYAILVGAEVCVFASR